ncbi:MAG: flagellin [Planctomycetota bacterium]
MARINTNIASMVAQSNLSRSNNDLQVRLQRLSTGLRINRGADDPAGLIVSESLRSEIKGLEQAVRNSERASSVIATTEGYLNEVAELLTSIKGLVVEAANTGGLSREEIEANQLQVDSAIDSITRISNTATFAGLQLLNGSMEYLVSGVAASSVSDINIYGAQFGNQPSVPVQVEVISSAQTAALYVSGNGTGQLTSSVTLEIAGNRGVQTITFVSGTQLSAVVHAVNILSESTGVSAGLVSATNQTSGLFLYSTAFGSDQFVSVKKLGDSGDFFTTFDAQGGSEVKRDEGRDVNAIVNGALAVGRGLELTLNTPTLSVDFVLSDSFATQTTNVEEFFITGGGVNFQLGPSVTTTQQIGFGVKSVAASRLGGSTIEGVRYFLDSVKTGQSNSLVSGNTQNASDVIDSAINDISTLRGRLGAFERNTVQTNVRALQIGVENITSSESKIRDADFASETAALTRAQILSQAGTSVLATANVTAQNVLSLLG